MTSVAQPAPATDAASPWLNCVSRGSFLILDEVLGN